MARPIPPETRRRLAAGITLATIIGAVAWWQWRPVSIDDSLGRGRECLARRQFGLARRLAEELLGRQPDSVPALLLAAEAEIGIGRTDQALSLLARVSDDRSPDACAVRIVAGQVFLNQQRELASAEREFRRALRLCPESTSAHEGMAFVLGLQSRQWEAAPHRLLLLGAGREAVSNETRLQALVSLALGDSALENPELIAEFQRAAPDDPGVQLALARIAFELKNFKESQRILIGIARGVPERLEAQARWGRVLTELDDRAEYEAWARGLSAECETHPGIWYARAIREVRDDNRSIAIRCLWELLRRDPNHQPACYQLGQLLAAEGKKAEAALFLERARRLEAFVKTAEIAFHLQEAKKCLDTARRAEGLGLLREAAGWAAAAHELDPDFREASDFEAHLRPRLVGLPPARTASGASPAEKIDLSAFPLPEASPARSKSTWANDDVAAGPVNKNIRQTLEADSPPETGAVGVSLIHFNDQAAIVGLDFTYRNGGDPRSGIVRMYEVVGGGVAVLDFDLDGAPDVYFPQGSNWPPDAAQRDHLDRLFHNVASARYQDVTLSAGIVEPGFSQGATAGDVDDDGFPDLYVANIGGNRLFLNNGDGTFRDATDSLPRAEGRYTSSVLIADLNGDALPDLVAVNYMEGDDLFTRVCGDSSGRVGSCLPQLFESARSQIFLSRGDGGFEDLSVESGLDDVAGKGLGIVAFDPEGSGMLALFVANDVGPNFLWINQAEPRMSPRFIEQGLTAGVAMNRSGQFESAMGVAAGDADGDGSLDLFVTNFEEETNTLYRQFQPGQFVDATTASGLGSKRQPNVGWGAQFLDADLDGHADLLFTNGHVNNVEHQNKPFRMPTQFFRNIGRGRFAELPAGALGPWFESARLGRGVARLDWNGDGLDDAIVTHLDAPAALLTNRTEPHGHYAAFELRGTKSSRDAIGATVRVVASGRTLVRHLTAGDGNQSSNQRRLIFGLGNADSIDEVTCHWPSGEVQVFRDLPVDRVWICIEGRSPLPYRGIFATAN